MASVSCALPTSQSRCVHGQEQQQMADMVRARSCQARMGLSTNGRVRATRTVASLDNCRVESRFVRVRSRRCGIGAGFNIVLPSRPQFRRMVAISRRDGDEFGEGAETDGDAGVGSETSSLEDQEPGKGVRLDLQLPRRRLLVEFTCNVCKARTQRLVNPEAYKRGTVYVQCGGCETYHQLVDNLGLVVEYDFRKETDSNSR